jgi:zinc/manganese transport system substrate-binding protein/zinc transport system substrate-binding protein
MKEAKVRVIIAEPFSDTALVQRIAALGGAREVELAASVGALPEARDYIALFDVDVARLAEALRSR